MLLHLALDQIVKSENVPGVVSFRLDLTFRAGLEGRLGKIDCCAAKVFVGRVVETLGTCGVVPTLHVLLS